MSWLSDIISAVKAPRELIKTRLEISKLQADAKQRASLVRMPSDEDVQRFDPKAQELEDAIRKLEDAIWSRQVYIKYRGPAGVFDIGRAGRYEPPVLRPAPTQAQLDAAWRRIYQIRVSLGLIPNRNGTHR